MSYAEFTLESAESRLGLVVIPGDLFPGLTPLPVPDWLRDLLERGQSIAALVSEKARSETLVMPVLLACRELVPGSLTIYSGGKLDVDPERGLVGECDFILASTPLVPRLRAPLLMVLEAKRGDIELGLGQCVAQMAGAKLFNERSGIQLNSVYGVVTTGESWQFLRLSGSNVVLHRTRLFIDAVGDILAALKSALSSETPGTSG